MTIYERIQWLRNYIVNYHSKKQEQKTKKLQDQDQEQEIKENPRVLSRPIGSFFFSEESCLYREFLAELKNDPKYIASSMTTPNINLKKPQFVFDNYFYHPSITVSKKTYKNAIQLCDELDTIFIPLYL
jgi:hypothetical protein